MVSASYAPATLPAVGIASLLGACKRLTPPFSYTGYLHTGLFNVWDLSSRLSAYSVLAESGEDIASATAFASRYNLRVVVKNTGHDWFTRSNAPGSLLIWTHLLNEITFNDAWTSGCAGSPAIATVTIGAGVQFRELYSAAMERGVVAMGGTCDSVGAVGCWLGGCYGTMSRKYGSGAANMVSARIALANGTIVTASACENPSLFWSLRGGGGGLGGVVIEVTARTHRAPQFILNGGGSYTANDRAGWQQLLEMQLNYTLNVMAPPWGGGVGWSVGPNGGGSVSFWPRGFEVNASVLHDLLSPFDALVAAQPARFSGSQSGSYWFASSWRPGDTLPWMEPHPDREISTALLASFSRYPPVRMFDTGAGAAATAASIIEQAELMPTGVRGIAGGIDFEKSQYGADPAALALLAETSTNPVVAASSGLLLIMYNVPSLPTVAPSAALLRRLWPRMKTYIAAEPSDSWYGLCQAAADGAGATADAQAAECLRQWRDVRAPPMQTALKTAKAAMVSAFPNIDARGAQFSGFYIHEGDFDADDWQAGQWGDSTYARLLAVKQAYDPEGLFYCHHCVGSEAWDNTGNCRI